MIPPEKDSSGSAALKADEHAGKGKGWVYFHLSLPARSDHAAGARRVTALDDTQSCASPPSSRPLSHASNALAIELVVNGERLESLESERLGRRHCDHSCAGMVQSLHGRRI
jgi:hypothetical protein